MPLVPNSLQLQGPGPPCSVLVQILLNSVGSQHFGWLWLGFSPLLLQGQGWMLQVPCPSWEPHEAAVLRPGGWTGLQAPLRAFTHPWFGLEAPGSSSSSIHGFQDIPQVFFIVGTEETKPSLPLLQVPPSPPHLSRGKDNVEFNIPKPDFHLFWKRCFM